MLGDISGPWPAVGITSDLIIHLNKTIEGNKVLISPRELPGKAKKELTVVEEKLQETHMHWVDPNNTCILVLLPSWISPIGILMQKEDIILEWIILTK